MYWKYHIEPGDHVTFEYDGTTAHGTIRQWVAVTDVPSNPDVSEIEPDDYAFIVQSGQEEVQVPMPDIKSRVKEDERRTDIPLLSETMRLTGGVGQR